MLASALEGGWGWNISALPWGNTSSCGLGPHADWTQSWGCHPRNVHSCLLGLKLLPCWFTIFKIKTASAPRVKRGLLNKAAARLCYMIMGLFPWCYRQGFRLCSSKQELMCTWSTGHGSLAVLVRSIVWPFDLLMQCLLYVAEHFPPLLGNIYWYWRTDPPVISGRDQIFSRLNFMLPKWRK